MLNSITKVLLSMGLLISLSLIGGCVSSAPPSGPSASAPAIDDCPGDSVLINGECIGVDEDGNPK